MPKESLRESLGLTEPPMNWFCGFGHRATGLSRVTYSAVFERLGEGEVGRKMQQWTHFTGNPATRRDSAERKQRAASVQEANNFVTGIVGFSPREIMDRARQLEIEYKGRDAAPFPVELY
ncbi:MAG: hypothetical protein M1372_02440 [Patescibacteria group bacterium]|nr:hypothetical protein [Patescibacteria group bacterium]